MQHAPRLFSDKGKFLPLAEVLVTKLESADPSKHARYIALRDAAVANQEAEARAVELQNLAKEKQQELRAANKAHSEAHPQKSFNECWREARDSRGWGFRPPLPPSESTSEEAAILKQHDEAIRKIEDDLLAIRDEVAKTSSSAVKATRRGLAKALKEFWATWPPLSDAQLRRQHLEGQKAARRGLANPGNTLGDTQATHTFIQKHIRVDMHRGAFPQKYRGMRRDPETGSFYVPDARQPDGQRKLPEASLPGGARNLPNGYR